VLLILFLDALRKNFKDSQYDIFDKFKHGVSEHLKGAKNEWRGKLTWHLIYGIIVIYCLMYMLITSLSIAQFSLILHVLILTFMYIEPITIYLSVNNGTVQNS